jgi:hypothetical protein
MKVNFLSRKCDLKEPKNQGGNSDFLMKPLAVSYTTSSRTLLLSSSLSSSSSSSLYAGYSHVYT